ncbi:hypothetical protein [Rhodospirillaceae bacterium SYSU D60014]|uniref:hypothetical protein n=1 Tax=Virgifigura deserti TaxID=2268457 RepID=UPI0013C497C7
MSQRDRNGPGERATSQPPANGDPRLQQRHRRSKNIALLLILVGFAVLIYIVAIIRMSGG